MLALMAIGQMGHTHDTIMVTFGCAQVAVGEQICVPVYADNYIDVTGFSLLLTWDPMILRFTWLQNE
jgi:hypothetical protein